MLKTKTHLFLISALFFLFIFSNCNVKEAEVNKNEIQAPKLSVFQNNNFRAIDNRIFLWPKDILPEQVSRAIEIGKVMDRVQSESIDVRKQLTDIRNHLKSNEDQIDQAYLKLNSEKNKLRNQLRDQRVNTANLNAARERKEAEEKNHNPDLAEIQNWETQLAELERSNAELSRQIEQSRAKIQAINLEITRLTDDPALTLEKAKKDEIEKQLQEMTEIGENSLKEVQGLVYWFDPQPSEVSMIFEKDGSLSVSITGWAVDRDEGPRDFSTLSKNGQKPTIRNAHFTPLGGVFEFDVYVYHDPTQTQLREKYSFHLALNPPDSENSAGNMIGDITMTRYLGYGRTEIHKGQAKLIDRPS